VSDYLSAHPVIATIALAGVVFVLLLLDGLRAAHLHFRKPVSAAFREENENR